MVSKHFYLRVSMISAVGAWGSTASALTQPDGTQIPSDMEVHDELALLGETIDPLTDAAVTPQTFRPECTLTFTVLRRLTDYRNSFGWYNVTGEVPTLDQLYEFIHCDDPPETWQQGEQTTRVLDIRNDARYLGGEIGFFQARATNPGPSGMAGGCADVTDPASVEFVVFSQPELNPEQTDDPFIHLLIMDSAIDSSVFYFAWEDLLSGGDNDFSDLIIRVEGVTCSGGGEPCATGQVGVCGAGLTQCDNGVITCKPRIPATDESCNGLDDDCDGAVDDGDLCAASEICERGVCIAGCNSGEFPCPVDRVCRSDGYCVDPACENVDCAEGQVCRGGECIDPCGGVICPYGQECRAGRCVDPCSGVSCGENQACVSGACLTTCECSGCPEARFCDPVQKQCIETACDGVNCAEGSHCSGGTCVDDCTGAVCPLGQTCLLGVCEGDVLGGSAATTTSSVGAGGTFPVSGSTASSPASSTATGDGSSTGSSGGGSGPSAVARDGDAEAGCACRVAPATSAYGWLGWLALGGLLRRSRRIRVRARELAGGRAHPSHGELN
ncbi:MAG TPA: DUF4114 domain-containing protein [Polyangiaceae bacterium]|nr:DUF4114 domain-containing protein [Polyangiaceae bacterium]